jgi:hypothetical protein
MSELPELTPEEAADVAVVRQTFELMLPFLRGAEVLLSRLDVLDNKEQVLRERSDALAALQADVEKAKAAGEKEAQRFNDQTQAQCDALLKEAHRDAKKINAQTQKLIDEERQKTDEAKLQVIGEKRSIAELRAQADAGRAVIGMMLQNHPEVAAQFSN